MSSANPGADTADWNGLKRLERTLPSPHYFDPAHHAVELDRIWYCNWVYLCRADELAEPLCFRTFTLGSQPLLVLRDADGALRAFYNTCRHRGSTLCAEPLGRLPARSLTCPYHGWTYDLRGKLLRIPAHGRPKPVDTNEFPLYAIAVQNWHGFVFVNLAAQSARTLDEAFGADASKLANWPLAELVVGQTRSTVLDCNWKVFWENYNECLHCPNVHPALSAVVPIYRRAIMEERDDPQWRAHAGSDDPQYMGGLRAGAATWSMDGRSTGHEFAALSATERRIGYHFVTCLPSVYFVGHVDYVRAVRIHPLGPERTELRTQWLYPREALADPQLDLANTVDFAAQVMAEDGAACELVQRGLHSRPHAAGVLLPEEYEVYGFQSWVRAELARA